MEDFYYHESAKHWDSGTGNGNGKWKMENGNAVAWKLYRECYCWTQVMGNELEAHVQPLTGLNVLVRLLRGLDLIAPDARDTQVYVCPWPESSFS